MKWRKARGFESRRTVAVAVCGGYRFSIRKHERLAGVWTPCGRFSIFLDEDFLGDCETLEAAKLAATLYSLEYIGG